MSFKSPFWCNHQQADSLQVHGVAIPTIDGIRNVLKHIGARADIKRTHVLWINLREEPVSVAYFFSLIYDDNL